MMQSLARQLGRPSGWLSRWFFSSLWNRRNLALNDAAFGLLCLSPTARVLEIGFGGGYLLGKVAAELDRLVPGGLLVGIDHSIEMVRICQRRFHPRITASKLQLALASAMALPFSGVSFDNVVSVNSIFYWRDPVLALHEIARVLSFHGQLVLVWTGREDMRDRPFSKHGLHLVQPDEIEKHLHLAGFCEVEVTQRQDRYRSFWCLRGVWSGEPG